MVVVVVLVLAVVVVVVVSWSSTWSWASGVVSSSSGSIAPRSRSRRGTPSGFFNAHGDNYFIFYKGKATMTTYTVCPGGESIVLCMRTCLASPRPRRSPSPAACAVGLYYIAQKMIANRLIVYAGTPLMGIYGSSFGWVTNRLGVPTPNRCG